MLSSCRFEQEELPVVHKLLKQPVEKVQVDIFIIFTNVMTCMLIFTTSSVCLQQAGLYPSVEQIELFSNHLPNAKLHEILVSNPI